MYVLFGGNVIIADALSSRSIVQRMYCLLRRVGVPEMCVNGETIRFNNFSSIYNIFMKYILRTPDYATSLPKYPRGLLCKKPCKFALHSLDSWNLLFLRITNCYILKVCADCVVDTTLFSSTASCHYWK